MKKQRMYCTSLKRKYLFIPANVSEKILKKGEEYLTFDIIKDSVQNHTNILNVNSHVCINIYVVESGLP